jgi:hypothetical protein
MAQIKFLRGTQAALDVLIRKSNQNFIFGLLSWGKSENELKK